MSPDGRVIPWARRVAVESWTSDGLQPDGGLVPTDGSLRVASAVPVWPVPMSRLRAAIELVLLIPAGLVGGVLAAAWVDLQDGSDPRWADLLATVGAAVGLLIGTAVMLSRHRGGFAGVGLTLRALPVNIILGVVALVPTYAVLLTGTLTAAQFYPELLAERAAAREAIEQQLPPASLSVMAMVMAIVVLWEEVVFRGMMLTRLRTLFGRWWLAVPASTLLFAALHYKQGLGGVVLICGLALVFSGLFIWRRSLVPCMTAHWLHNMAMLWLLQSIPADYPMNG